MYGSYAVGAKESQQIEVREMEMDSPGKWTCLADMYSLYSASPLVGSGKYL